MLESLIELLLKNRIITPEELQMATEEQESNGGRLESILVRFGYLEEEDLVSFLCNFYKIPFFKLSQLGIKPEVIKLIPSDYVRKHLIVPVHHYRSRLTLAMVDPGDRDVIDQMAFLTGFNIEPIGASETEIISAIKKYYGDENDIFERSEK